MNLNADAEMEAANLQVRLATAETSLDLADLLVAAAAREHGGTLATANRSDFDKPSIYELLDMVIVDVSAG